MSSRNRVFSQVKVTHDNLGQLSLFGEEDSPWSHLALHAPGDETQVVALYLHGKWWPVGDVLKTSDKSRSGLVVVESVMERVVLFLLSQVIFGIQERPQEEHMYFSPHPIWEFCKILWLDGEAVGFYSVKKKGSLCDGYTGQSYLLPVLDTMFVRTHWRRKGLALRMLEDFCTSLSEQALGISFPVSPSMYEVCRKYLEIHQEERDRLYEVEAPGDWSQRRNVWLSIQLQKGPTITKTAQCPDTLSSHRRRELLSRGKTTDGKLEKKDSSTTVIRASDLHRGAGEKRPADKAEGTVGSKQAKTIN
ncbi:protein FAM169B isoform X2 [Chanos chanos]|uniref:Protein FAM169B isoform X2 n=1 Tax=Chanos chanos TaxID=29144 RepID=A0A6J2UPY8_CHACN|nr:protein FAM169B isoform X2 [Chanos chanos]